MSGYNIWGKLTTTSEPTAPIDDDALINAGVNKGREEFQLPTATTRQQRHFK